MSRLDQLQKKYFSMTPKIDLVNEKRTFVRETSVLVLDKIEKKNSVVLLFNDSILIFRPKKETHVKIYLQSLLVDISLGEIYDTSCFDIVYFVFFFATIMRLLMIQKKVKTSNNQSNNGQVTNLSFKEKSEAERWYSIINRYVTRQVKESLLILSSINHQVLLDIY